MSSTWVLALWWLDVYKRQVATVAIGKAGAKNAAILAAQMIALSDDEMAEKMEAFKKAMAEKVIKDSVIEVE